MARIAILDDYQNVALEMADWSDLRAENQITVFNYHLGPEAQAAAALADFDIICAMRERTQFPRSMIEKLPKLKLLATSGMRNAAIDMQAAADAGITVCGTTGPGHATAELTWALILSMSRHIPEEFRNMSRGRWQTTLGVDLKGKTLGLLGLGRLGQQVANIGRAFGMDVIAWSQNLTEEKATEGGARLVDKAALFAEADFLSIHVVLSKRSRGLVGSEDLARMKPTAYLVNTSRGPIVDELALVHALKNAHLAGAAVDVYGEEPLPADHPMRGYRNLLLTPHIGYVTRETYQVFYGQMVEDIVAFQAGAPTRVIT